MCRLDAEVAQSEVTIPWGRKHKIGVSVRTIQCMNTLRNCDRGVRRQKVVGPNYCAGNVHSPSIGDKGSLRSLKGGLR